MRFYNWLTDNIKLIGTKILAGITLTLALHIFFVTDVYAQALDFDGVDDYASASGGLANNSNFTLEAWVKPRNFTSYNWVIQVGDVALGASSSGYLTYLVDGSTSGSVSTQLIPLNTWSHIALVYYNGSYILYYNGVALASTPQFSYTGKAPDYLAGFYFSRNGGSEGWFGGIDEVRIWNVARTSAEISASYNAQLANPTGQTGLAGYYQLNEGTPGGTNTGITSLLDASGYGHPAALTGFAMTGATSNYIGHTFASCANPTDGGTIGTAQTIAPGSTPSGLTQTVAPAGTPVGTLQYQWQSSVTSSSTGFSDITGATTTSYSPGALSQNTWYKRLVKVDCESNWVASNVVELTVVNSVTWTGATSTDWNTASNWNPAVVPTATVDATIPASGVTNYPEVASGTNAQVKNITHNGIVTKRITVASGGKLTVNGSYTAAANAEIKL